MYGVRSGILGYLPTFHAGNRHEVVPGARGARQGAHPRDFWLIAVVVVYKLSSSHASVASFAALVRLAPLLVRLGRLFIELGPLASRVGLVHFCLGLFV